MDRTAPSADPVARRALGKSKDTVVTVRDIAIGTGEFVVIAGPCAVESKAQVSGTAAVVKSAGGHLLRGGLHKPRTSPYSFQGLGDRGLTLLHQAARAYGLGTVSEVMDASQIPSMLGSVDLLQVGARNMQNFSLLRELGKLRTPVMLKRGLCATIDEWLLAAEYLLEGGNDQVILCERGIRTFETCTRYTLDLAGVAYLKQRTHLPVLVDPSHATGDRNLVIPMALAAATIGADGLLVEVHPDPANALCDGPQALTPQMFRSLMETLPAVLGAVGRTLHAPASQWPEQREAAR